jgi:aldehyde:ferredoxin oxidoreductase
MHKIYGCSNSILEVDLSNRTYNISKISKTDRKHYLGGKGLALKQIYDRQAPGVKPLEPENILAISNGVIIGTGAPCSARFSAVAKSPLTGIFTHSSCGGPFGMALKTSTWEILLIRGKSASPVYLVISSQGVKFKDATILWGKTTSETAAAIADEGSGSLVIGPAGENQIPFANIRSGHRFLGRGGLGAVMGSKNLKAIVALGKECHIIPNKKNKFKKITKKFNRYIKQNQVTGDEYNKLGTSAHVIKSNLESILPVNNFQENSHRLHEHISGEYYHKHHSKANNSCKFCIIRCGHQAIFNGDDLPVPEYETIGLLGANLGIFNSEKIARWNHLCGELGLDTISTGGTLAWVMEATEKGIYKSSLKFGEEENIPKAIKGIAYLDKQYKELGIGSRALSEKYGGREFSIQIKGLELAAYHPGRMLGQSLSYAVANRGGCHLSGAVFALETYFKLTRADQVFGKALMVKFFENLYAAVNSIHICQFTAYAAIFEAPLIRFTPEFILKRLMTWLPGFALQLIPLGIYSSLWSSVVGHSISTRDFKKAGARIHLLERYMNTLEGISRKDDTLPGSLMTNNLNYLTADKLNLLIKKYYKLRKYDKNGIPKINTLIKHSIKPREEHGA